MWTQGERIKKHTDLIVGETYCIKYKHMGEASECAFGTYSRSLNQMALFERVDLPDENSPDFNPYEPLEIGGRWTELIVYKAEQVYNNNTENNNNNNNNDPTNVNVPRNMVNANDPVVGGRRYTKSSRKSRRTRRRNTRKH